MIYGSNIPPSYHHYYREQHFFQNSKLLLYLQIKEIFGVGTACVVCPVNKIGYKDQVVVFLLK